MTLNISVGRLGVILDQEYTAKALLVGEEPWSPLGALPEDAGEREALDAQYLALYLTVLGHNALQAEACARAIVGEKLCKRQYLPLWLDPPAEVHPSAAQIRRWSNAAQSAMLPLWVAICDRAVAKSGDLSLCAIE